ncbi:MAG TPA: cell division protein ZapA [candidate division Zixibacteria bacterium]|nr:cell division protein ZapA [candidate division Zixibacteria bacterium]
MIDDTRNTKTTTIKVDIFGKEYSIRSNENSDLVVEVARFVDSKMREIDKGGHSSNPVQVAVLAAMNISADLFSAQRSKEEAFSDIDKRCKELIERISSAIHQDS